MQPKQTIGRIATKEITLFFASPIAYLFLAAFAGVTGGGPIGPPAVQRKAPLRGLRIPVRITFPCLRAGETTAK